MRSSDGSQRSSALMRPDDSPGAAHAHPTPEGDRGRVAQIQGPGGLGTGGPGPARALACGARTVRGSRLRVFDRGRLEQHHHYCGVELVEMIRTLAALLRLGLQLGRELV